MTEVFAALAGDGSAILAAPRLVSVLGCELTTVPAGVAITSGGNPRRVMKAGWLAPSRIGTDAGWPATLFCEGARWINFERQQLHYSTPGVFCDRIRYHLEPGVIATLYVNDSTPVPTLTQQLQPWDRAAVSVSQYTLLNLTPGAGFQQLWTYTVPGGRNLWIGGATCGLLRATAATAVASMQVVIRRAGTIFLYSLVRDNTVGARDHDDLGAPVIARAGEVLLAEASDGSAGGVVSSWASLVGFLFDA